MRASALTYQGSSTRVDDPDFAYLNDYVDAVGNAEDAVTQSAETLQKAQQAYEEALAERDARQGDYMEALSAVARAQADYITALSLAEQSDNGAMQGAGLGTEGAGSGAATKAASEPKHARVVNPAEGETALAEAVPDSHSADAEGASAGDAATDEGYESTTKPSPAESGAEGMPQTGDNTLTNEALAAMLASLATLGFSSSRRRKDCEA